MSEFVEPKFRIMKKKNDKYIVQEWISTTKIEIKEEKGFFRTKKVSTVVPVSYWRTARRCESYMYSVIYTDFEWNDIILARKYINRQIRERRRAWELEQLPELRFVEDYP